MPEKSARKLDLEDIEAHRQFVSTAMTGEDRCVNYTGGIAELFQNITEVAFNRKPNPNRELLYLLETTALHVLIGEKNGTRHKTEHYHRKWRDENRVLRAGIHTHTSNLPTSVYPTQDDLLTAYDGWRNGIITVYGVTLYKGVQTNNDAYFFLAGTENPYRKSPVDEDMLDKVFRPLNEHKIYPAQPQIIYSCRIKTKEGANKTEELLKVKGIAYDGGYHFKSNLESLGMTTALLCAQHDAVLEHILVSNNMTGDLMIFIPHIRFEEGFEHGIENHLSAVTKGDTVPIPYIFKIPPFGMSR